MEGIRLQRRRSTMKNMNDATKETLEKLDVQGKYILSSLLQRKLKKKNNDINKMNLFDIVQFSINYQ